MPRFRRVFVGGGERAGGRQRDERERRVRRMPSASAARHTRRTCLRSGRSALRCRCSPRAAAHWRRRDPRALWSPPCRAARRSPRAPTRRAGHRQWRRCGRGALGDGAARAAYARQLIRVASVGATGQGRLGRIFAHSFDIRHGARHPPLATRTRCILHSTINKRTNAAVAGPCDDPGDYRCQPVPDGRKPLRHRPSMVGARSARRCRRRDG